MIRYIIEEWSIEKLENHIKYVKSFPKQNIKLNELKIMEEVLKSKKEKGEK
jgi:hypothetical protein